MIIDIIDYDSSQYAALSSEKIEKVRDAQNKKNKLLQTLAAQIEKERQQLVDNGIYVSTIFEKRVAELTAEREAEIDAVREALLFYLHYATNDGSSGESASNVPYPVDYSLSVEDRMWVVRGYYETTYPNAAERFSVFKEDKFAKSYLGELYAPL